MIHLIPNHAKILTVLSVFSFLIISCGTSEKLSKDTARITDHPTTSATLWAQNAAEYDALTLQVYQTALSKLALSLEDSYWTALPLQENSEDYYKLPPAIIVDVDETVLDNSPFQARMILSNSDFNREDWNSWVREANADPLDGAVNFLQAAAKRNVTIFYVTNRNHELEDATYQNLKVHGFPLNEDRDLLLTRNERENWGSDKKTRRQFIAQNYRVIMLFGDNLNDFTTAINMSQEERDRLVSEHSNKWGRQWFMLPNPVYGSWEQAIFNFESNLTDDERNRLIEKHLNTKN